MLRTKIGSDAGSREHASFRVPPAAPRSRYSREGALGRTETFTLFSDEFNDTGAYEGANGTITHIRSTTRSTSSRSSPPRPTGRARVGARYRTSRIGGEVPSVAGGPAHPRR
jgi:hypothetical protein